MDNIDRKLEYIKEIKSLVCGISDIITIIETDSYMIGEIPISEENVISEHRVCIYIDIHQRTMRRLRQRFKIPFFKEGRTIMYKVKDLRYALDSGIINKTDKTMKDIIIGHAKYVRQRSISSENK